MHMETVPLQKWLQRMGAGSRQTVRTWIVDGRVSVNGEVIRRFAHPVTMEHRIEVDGRPVIDRAPRTVLLMNKPKRHITALTDLKGRPALGQYLPQNAPLVFPVGRLDFNTEGALLFTNDGALARAVLDPELGLPKTYRVKIRGHLHPDDEGLQRMRAGMRVGGSDYKPAEVRVAEKRTRATWVEITLREGQHRQIRKMCAACRFQIVKLRRTRIGPVELGDLNPRCVRSLTEEEIRLLDLATEKPQERGPVAYIQQFQ